MARTCPLTPQGDGTSQSRGFRGLEATLFLRRLRPRAECRVQPLSEEATMSRTSRIARRHATMTWLREWRLPGPERAAARSARAVKRQMRLERANKYRNKQGGGGGPMRFG